MAEVVVVEDRIQGVEALEQAGEEFLKGRQVGFAAEMAGGLQFAEEEQELLRGALGFAGAGGGIAFLANGGQALLHRVDEVEEAVRGVGLLEEKLGDVAGLAAGLVEPAVGVLRTEHAQQGGEFGVVAVVAGARAAGAGVGAEDVALAQEFVKFCLTREAQRLWFQKPGTKGGPEDRALHRTPIRRDMYDAETLALTTMPGVNPYEDEGNFTYDRALTGKVFNTLRTLVKVMCIDSHEEMKSAWEAIIAAGMPEDALAVFQDVSKVTYAIAGPGDAGLDSKDSMMQAARMKELGEWFRANYREARRIAETKGARP